MVEVYSPTKQSTFEETEILLTALCIPGLCNTQIQIQPVKTRKGVFSKDFSEASEVF